MREIDDLLEAYRRHGRATERLLLATVVRVAGSTYRRIGARMLMSADRHLAGAISGGCLESDVLQKALWRTGAGAMVVRYDSRADDELGWTLGLGCNGLVDVLVERLEPGRSTHVLEALARARNRSAAVAIATVLERTASASVGARVVVDADGALHADVLDPHLLAAVAERSRDALDGGVDLRSVERVLGTEVLVERIGPPVPLVIFGTGVDVAPVVEFAKALGWHVTVVGTRPVGHLAGRFPHADVTITRPLDQLPSKVPLGPETLALLMTHNLGEDLDLLETLLPSPVRYLGVLGPRSRTERLLEKLAARGVRPTAAQRARLFAPVGLDLGAEGPHEIALAVIAEMRAMLAERPAGFLRERAAPIHEQPAEPISMQVSAGDAACAIGTEGQPAQEPSTNAPPSSAFAPPS